MPAPLATSLHTAGQVGLIDRTAIDVLGIPGPELMRRAAVAAFALLRRRWPDARRLLLLAGNGNNGGDAFLSLVKTCDKLGISFWDYLGDRLVCAAGSNAVPYLPHLVGQRSPAA